MRRLTNMTNSRSSAVELYRVGLMTVIVWYHLILRLPDVYNDPTLNASLNILHLGVPCFVLLSGWFGIRPSGKGFFRIWAPVFFYGVTQLVLAIILGIESFNVNMFFRTLFPCFGSRWWFVSTYLALYIISPMVNTFYEKCDKIRVYGVVIGLFVISFWFSLGEFGEAILGCSRLPMFVMLYLLGRILHDNWQVVQKTRGIEKMFSLLIIVSLVLGSMATQDRKCAFMSKYIFFNYNAPGLVVISLLFMIVIFRLIYPCMDWKSCFVNKVALSVFPVYVLHEHNPVLSKLMYGYFAGVVSNMPSAVVLLLGLLYAVLVVVFCIIIDQILRPCHVAIATRANSLFQVVIHFFILMMSSHPI